MKIFLRIIHCLAIALSVSIMCYEVSDLLRFQNIDLRNLEALAKVILFLIGTAFGVIIIWKSIQPKKRHLKFFIFIHIIYSLVFSTFYFAYHNVLPEVHSFDPEAIRHEYYMGILGFIVSMLIWFGFFSIGPILKAWDIRHK